jgi:hypothetical protein
VAVKRPGDVMHVSPMLDALHEALPSKRPGDFRLTHSGEVSRGPRRLCH